MVDSDVLACAAMSMTKRLAVIVLLMAIGCNDRLGLDADEEGNRTEANQAAEKGPWVVRAYYQDRAALAALAAEHAPWEVHPDEQYAVIEIHSQAEFDAIASAGYTLVIDEALTAVVTAPPPDTGVLAGIPGYPCYRTVEESYNTAATIATNFPNLATWIDIGNSWEKTTGVGPGYDIRVLRLTNQAIPGPKPVMFVMAAIHAREYVTAETLTRLAEYLVNNHGTNADVTWLLDTQEFHFVLQTNPDGRKHAETGELWRKNTNQNYCGSTSSSRGADLNRNYPFLWGGGGSSGSQCSETYRGTTPGSEPETQAITAYVRSIFPDQRDESGGLNAPAPPDATGIFFDLHSYSELVLWPWGFGTNVAPNNTALRTLGRKLAYFNGYNPMQSVELYPADGVTIDFAYGELGVASYVFEMGTSFFQSCSTFESTIYPKNFQALLFAAKVARTPYLTPAGPESMNVTLTSANVPQGMPAHINAIFNDTRFSNVNGTEPIQTVAAAEVYVDVPPWAPGATALAMTANDGSFNQTIETAGADIDTGGLAQGSHTLYVRGRDSASNWGSVSAVFVNILPTANQLPSVTITSPSNGTTVNAGTPITLTATATDTEDGNLTSSIVWTSSIDGPLATGGSGSVVLSGGTHQITASVTDSQSGTGSASVSVTVIVIGTIFADTFDGTPAGWTTSGLWHSVSNTSCTAPAQGSTSAPNAMYYGQNSTCNYATGAATSGNLESPLITGVGANAVLRFNYFRKVESYAASGYDISSVQIVSGATTTTVFSLDSRNASQANWLASGDISLAAFAGQSIRVRFRFDSRDGVANNFTGWLVDDVAVINQ